MKTLSRFLFLVSFCAFLSTHLYAQNLIITTQNNTNCSSPNGVISASVDGETNSYSFEWFVGSSETGPHLSWNATVTNMVGGMYTVKAIHAITGAVVGPISAIITNEVEVPVIAVQVLANETCLSGGSLTALVSGSASDYTYAWYQGTRVSGVAISTDQTLNQLSAGTYTVMVTHNFFGCQNSAYGTVLDQRPIQNISVQVMSNVTSCGSPNGSLKAIVPEVASNYTYQWFQGAVSSGPILSTSQTLSNRAAGIYTVAVTHKVSKCKSIISAIISDQIVNPTVSIQVLSNVTSCTSSNGSLKAIISGSASKYTFKWYRGTTATGSVLSTSQTIHNLAAGSYTVLVTNRTTLCKTVVSATVQDTSVILAVQVVPHTYCWPNGYATVIISGTTTDYTFIWHSGPDLNGPVIRIGQTLDMVPAGTYTVSVDHNLSSCYATATVTIAEEFEPLNVSVQVISNTSCTTPNGALTAIVEGDPSDHYFEWYAGTDIFSAPLLSTNQILDQSPGGIYTLRVISNLTGCESITSASVADEIIIPNVFVQVLSNTNSCGYPSGVLSAVTSTPESNYTFAWYQGVDVSGIPISGFSVLTNLSAGVYTVKVTDNNSGCESIVSTTIAEETTSLSVTAQVISEQTSCTEPNGSLIAIVEGGMVADYYYEWYEGTVPYAGPILSTSPTITNLAAGIYTVSVTHKYSGCQAIISVALPQSCESIAVNNIAASGASVTVNSTDELKFSYYPNPTHETLWIESKAVTGSIVLMNKHGKIVHKQKISASEAPLAIDLADQPSGMYILNFTTGLHTSSYHIIKEY